jgi:hypothetical protein
MNSFKKLSLIVAISTILLSLACAEKVKDDKYINHEDRKHETGEVKAEKNKKNEAKEADYEEKSEEENEKSEEGSESEESEESLESIEAATRTHPTNAIHFLPATVETTPDHSTKPPKRGMLNIEVIDE